MCIAWQGSTVAGSRPVERLRAGAATTWAAQSRATWRSAATPGPDPYAMMSYIRKSPQGGVLTDRKGIIAQRAADDGDGDRHGPALAASASRDNIWRRMQGAERFSPRCSRSSRWCAWRASSAGTWRRPPTAPHALKIGNLVPERDETLAALGMTPEPQARASGGFTCRRRRNTCAGGGRARPRRAASRTQPQRTPAGRVRRSRLPGRRAPLRGVEPHAPEAGHDPGTARVLRHQPGADVESR